MQEAREQPLNEEIQEKKKKDEMNRVPDKEYGEDISAFSGEFELNFWWVQRKLSKLFKQGIAISRKNKHLF